MSREDLIQSREALTRMLADFSEHGQRSYDVRQIIRGASAVPTGFSSEIKSATVDSSSKYMLCVLYVRV